MKAPMEVASIQEARVKPACERNSVPETLVHRIPIATEDDQPASKKDLNDLGMALRGDMNDLSGALHRDMNDLNGALHSDMDDLRKELSTEFHGGLDQLRTELLSEMHGGMDRLRDELIDKMRDMQTEMLRAFHSWASPIEIRLRSLPNIEERLGLLEERVSTIERRDKLN
jgi:hypothetical protein